MIKDISGGVVEKKINILRLEMVRQGNELSEKLGARIDVQGKDMSKGFQHMAERQLDHTRVVIGSVIGIAALSFGLNKYDSSEKRHVVGGPPPLESIMGMIIHLYPSKKKPETGLNLSYIQAATSDNTRMAYQSELFCIAF